MLVRKNYEEAIRSFERAGNISYVKRVQAMKIERDAEFEMFRIKNLMMNPEKLSKEEFRLKKLKLTREKHQIYEILSEAGLLFEDLKLF
jgi:mannitol/fructose-specific phosphotransferase system IIA component (Ntr-type)